MTVAEANKLGDTLPMEDLVMFLSAPEPCDVRTITDPIAIFGTRPLEGEAVAARIGFGDDLHRAEP